MRLGFYINTIHVAFSDDEFFHLFKEYKRDTIYNVRINGYWDKGLQIVAELNPDSFLTTTFGHRYKVQIKEQGKSRVYYCAVGWTAFGGLQKSEFDVPIRCKLGSKLNDRNGEPLITLDPLDKGEFVKGSQSSPEKIVRTYATVNTKREPDLLHDTPTEIVRRPERVQAVLPPVVMPRRPLPVKAAEAVIQAPPRPTQRVEESTTNEKTIEEIKNLAIELNRVLAATDHLYVQVVDGKLVLEEEIVDYEEF